jgi:hypothetical protein
MSQLGCLFSEENKVFKKLTLLFLASLFGIVTKAQNVAYHDIALATITNTAVGTIVRPVSGALITVCAGVHTEIPCNSPTTIFSNPAGAFQANPFNADVNGNFTFYATPGNNFTVSITGVGVTGYSFPFFAPLITFGALGNATFTSLTSASVNPATGGAIRLSNTDQIQWRNFANSGNVELLMSGAGLGNTPADVLTSSSAFVGIQFNAFMSNNNQTAIGGVFRLGSGETINWRNNANSADISLAKLSSDVFTLGGNGLAVSTGFLQAQQFITTVGNPATTGVVRLATGDTICWRNNANSTDVCISKNASDQFVFGGTLLSPTLSTPVINGATTGTGIQGTDSKLLSSGTISGTGSALCTDGNGGATTSGCPSNGLKASVTLTGQTGAIGTATLCNTTNCPSGTYLITALVQGTVSCATGSSTVQVILSYTDDVGAKASSTVPLASLAGNFATTSSLATGTLGQGNYIVRTTGAQPIQYTTSYTSCSTGGPGTYNLLLIAFQLATP